MNDNTECLAIQSEPSWLRRILSRLSDRALDLAYRLHLMKRPKGNGVLHAEREFLAAGYIPLDQPQEDGPNKWMQENVLELLRVFGEQGHSGFSANYCIEVFRTLAKFEPLVPLQGTDDEWCEVHEGTWQNKRCSHVFKEADGRAYDIDGRIFREPSGACYTSRDSRVYVTFPYTPKREYVDVAT